MPRILALGASSSRKSINQQFAIWAASQIHDAVVDVVDLNDYEMPIYSIDKELEDGIPEPARVFKQKVLDADGIVISFAEHNGSYSSAFKNVFDWMSRLEKPIWSEKPMLLLSTSPGGRGGLTVLTTAVEKFPFQGGRVIASMALPFFSKHFEAGTGITDPELLSKFNTNRQLFEDEL